MDNPAEIVTFQQFMTWGFLGLLTAVVSICAKFLCDMSKSVAKLNENIAVLIARQNYFDKELNDHHNRLKHLEGIETSGYDS